MGWFKTSDYPTNGVAILQGEVPDLLFLAVRLPPDLNDLASHIIRQAERDNAALMTSQGMAAEPLRIENRHVDRKLPGCGNERDGCYHLEFSYVEVIGGPAAARARINAAILAFLTDRDEGRGMLTPESFAQDYIDSSASVQKEHPDFPSSSLTRAVTVLRSAAPVFSLAFYEEWTGGMHPIYTTQYYNFDSVTGEPVKLASILKDGSMARLTAIAEVHFRQVRKLAATAKLEDEYFTFPGGRFALNDNYGFSEKALLFFFNDYEIAPHSMGPTLVEMPYAEIRDLLRPGFPLGSPDAGATIHPGNPADRAPGAAGVYRVGHGVAAPVLIFKSEPVYSEEARKARYEGTVSLHVVVGGDGIAKDIQVLHGLGLGLDDKAIEAVRQWRFQPGTKDRQPVNVEAKVDVNFRMLEARWVTTRLQYQLAPNVSPPAIAQSPFPPACSEGGGIVTLALKIRSDGLPAGVSVLRTTNQSLNKAAVKAIQSWRFTPARQNGASASASAELDLRCNPAPAR